MSLILRTGKHAGKTVDEVEKIDPGYLQWIKANVPGMLKEKKIITPKPAVERIEPPELSSSKSAIQPNLNFFNEGKNQLLPD